MDKFFKTEYFKSSINTDSCSVSEHLLEMGTTITSSMTCSLRAVLDNQTNKSVVSLLFRFCKWAHSPHMEQI